MRELSIKCPNGHRRKLGQLLDGITTAEAGKPLILPFTCPDCNADMTTTISVGKDPFITILETHIEALRKENADLIERTRCADEKEPEPVVKPKYEKKPTKKPKA